MDIDVIKFAVGDRFQDEVGRGMSEKPTNRTRHPFASVARQPAAARFQRVMQRSRLLIRAVTADPHNQAQRYFMEVSKRAQEFLGARLWDRLWFGR